MDFVLNQSGQQIQSDLNLLDSNSATQGQVLTANGQGGASWQNSASGAPANMANMMTTDSAQTVSGTKTWQSSEDLEDGGSVNRTEISSNGTNATYEVRNGKSENYSVGCGVASDSVEINYKENNMTRGSFLDSMGIVFSHDEDTNLNSGTNEYKNHMNVKIGMGLNPKGTGFICEAKLSDKSNGDIIRSRQFAIYPLEGKIIISDFDNNNGDDYSTEILFGHRDFENGGSTETAAYLSDFNIAVSSSYGSGSIVTASYGLRFSMKNKTSGTFSLIGGNGVSITTGTCEIVENLITFTSNNTEIGKGAVNNHIITAAFNQNIADGDLVTPTIFADFIMEPQAE